MVWATYSDFIKGQCLCQWCTVWCIKLPHDWSGPPSLSSSKVSVSATVWCSDLTCDWFGPPTVTSSKVSASGTLFDVLAWGTCDWFGSPSLSSSKVSASAVVQFDVLAWLIIGMAGLNRRSASMPVMYYLMYWPDIWFAWEPFSVFIKGRCQWWWRAGWCIDMICSWSESSSSKVRVGC